MVHLATSLTSLAVMSFALSGAADDDPPSGEQDVLGRAIEALRATHDQLNGREGWRLVFRHEIHRDEAEKHEAEKHKSEKHEAEKHEAEDSHSDVGWTCTQLRQSNNMLVSREYPAGGKDCYAWQDGVGVYSNGGTVTVTPSYDPALSQITSFTNYMFIDVTPTDATWADPVKEVFNSRGPSEHFIWALPRTIESHRGEFRAEPADSEGLIRVRRGDRDVIVLDPSRGYACVSRRYEFKPGFPLFEIENRDFREVAPGLWLPGLQVVRKYAAPPMEEDMYGKVIAEERNELISFEFCDLEADAFHVDVPESGYVYDRVRKLGYRRFPEGTTPEQALMVSVDEALRWDNAIRLRWKWQTVALVAANLTLIAGLLVAWRQRVLKRSFGG